MSDNKARNPPDSEADLPPAYDQSSDQPYNPQYSPHQQLPCRTSDSQADLEVMAATDSLYPNVPAQRSQQQQQQRERQQEEEQSGRRSEQKRQPQQQPVERKLLDQQQPYSEQQQRHQQQWYNQYNQNQQYRGPTPQRHTIFISSGVPSLGREEERIALINEVIVQERRFPLAALFFLFGWFCPPLWFLGACCCAGNSNRYESWWGKVNFVMAMVTLITSMIYSIFALSTGHWYIHID